MFVTRGQFFVFLACVSFGTVCGVIFNIFRLLVKPIKYKVFQIISDVISFILTTIGYVYLSYRLYFPNIRLNMLVGVLLGVILYHKSFSIILANIGKKIYNIFKKKIKVGKRVYKPNTPTGAIDDRR